MVSVDEITKADHSVDQRASEVQDSSSFHRPLSTELTTTDDKAATISLNGELDNEGSFLYEESVATLSSYQGSFTKSHREDKSCHSSIQNLSEYSDDYEGSFLYEESAATLSSYQGSFTKSESYQGSYKKSNKEENSCHTTVTNESESSMSSSTITFEEDILWNVSEKSASTLPSYTEMCGEEDSRVGDVADHTSDAQTTSDSGGEPNADQIRLPGCFGAFNKGNAMSSIELKNCRYIGKQRVILDNLGNPVSRRSLADPARKPEEKPPADSTALGLKTLVNRWIADSDTKAEAETPDLRFTNDSDIRQHCPEFLPRLSSSDIAISSKKCANRKRKLDKNDNEALLSSRSETDITRPQAQRNVKRR